MATQNPYQQYQLNQVITAPPEELTLMLFKGAVKFISFAIKALDERALGEANNNIIKAEKIYYELLGTLDQKYPISKNLASLYDYLINLLIQANIRKDKAMLEEALAMAKEFVETWSEAIKVYRKSQGNREWVE